MPRLFGVDIAGEVAKGLGPGLLDAVLIQITEGSRDVNNPTAGKSASERKLPCKGMISDNVSHFLDNKNILGQGDTTRARVGDKNILLLGATIPGGKFPKPDDKVKIEGETFRIVRVLRDPAAATYQCLARI